MTTPTKWKRVGVCCMDTAGLLISDPCYVIATTRENGKLEPCKSGGDSVELDDYSAWITAKDEVVKLPFKRGHEGAGIIFHSPHGDGSVDVWAKLDAKGAVRSVFFSFDGERPGGKP